MAASRKDGELPASKGAAAARAASRTFRSRLEEGPRRSFDFLLKFSESPAGPLISRPDRIRTPPRALRLEFRSTIASAPVVGSVLDVSFFRFAFGSASPTKGSLLLLLPENKK